MAWLKVSLSPPACAAGAAAGDFFAADGDFFAFFDRDFVAFLGGLDFFFADFLAMAAASQVFGEHSTREFDFLARRFHFGKTRAKSVVNRNNRKLERGQQKIRIASPSRMPRGGA
jgi:hypothetical protein